MRGTLHYILREHLATVMRVCGLDPGKADKCEQWAKHYGVRIEDLQPWEEPVCEVVCCSVPSLPSARLDLVVFMDFLLSP